MQGRAHVTGLGTEQKKGESSFQSPECESRIASHQTRGEKINRFKIELRAMVAQDKYRA